MDTAEDRTPVPTRYLRVVLPEEANGSNAQPASAHAPQSETDREPVAAPEDRVERTPAPNDVNPRRKTTRQSLLVGVAAVALLGMMTTVYVVHTGRPTAPAQELGLRTESTGNTQAGHPTHAVNEAAAPAPADVDFDQGTTMAQAPAGDTAAAEAARMVGLPQQPLPAQPVPAQPSPLVAPVMTAPAAPAATQALGAPPQEPAVAVAPAVPATLAPVLPQAAPASPSPAPSSTPSSPAVAAPAPVPDTALAKAPSRDVMLGTFKMVTALAGRVAALAQQNAELQKQVGELSKTVESLSDLDQHLQFREADAAVQRAVSGDSAPAEPVAPRAGTRMRHGSRARDAATQAVDPGTGTDAKTPPLNPVPTKASAPRYKLQAASPDVAILDSGDNNATSIHVGDTLPGYGTIREISMRGGNWVVQTEHGVIQ